MRDPNIDPVLELDPHVLGAACKGDVTKLPKFVVHDNEAWPWGAKVHQDNKNRVHMKRSTFLRVVCPQLPVKPGVWIRADAQEFSIDLQPHHIGGSAETVSDVRQVARVATKADSSGRLPGHVDYDPENKFARRRPGQEDLAEARRQDGFKSLRTTGLVDPRSE